MAVCRFVSLLDGLNEGWLDDPVFRPIVDQDLANGQHRNPDPVGRQSPPAPTRQGGCQKNFGSEF
jgi:hypothetical protein